MNGSILIVKFWLRKNEKKIITKLEERLLYICVAHAKCRCANDRKINIKYVYRNIHDFEALNSNVSLLDIHFENVLIINCLNIDYINDISWPPKAMTNESTIIYVISKNKK